MTMGKGKAGGIIGLVMGLILVFYLISGTFNDASDSVEGINETYQHETYSNNQSVARSGASLVKLLPLFLGVGVVILVWRKIKT